MLDRISSHHLEIVRKALSAPRFKHSLNVAALAGELAKIHNCDQQGLELAGLFHDIAKEWSPQKAISYVRHRKLKIPDLNFIVQCAPPLLHAYIGADFVKKQGWIKDSKLLNAIASHTLGSLTMSDMDKILYIADFCSKERSFLEADQIRRVAFQNIEAGFRLSVGAKIAYQISLHHPIHPFAIDVWNHILKPHVRRKKTKTL